MTRPTAVGKLRCEVDRCREPCKVLLTITACSPTSLSRPHHCIRSRCSFLPRVAPPAHKRLGLPNADGTSVTSLSCGILSDRCHRSISPDGRSHGADGSPALHGPSDESANRTPRTLGSSHPGRRYTQTRDAPDTYSSDGYLHVPGTFHLSPDSTSDACSQVRHNHLSIHITPLVDI